MPFSITAKNSMLDTLLTTVYASLHTADPGNTGASEVGGGTYARVQVTLNASSNGTKTASNAPVINVPAGTTITHVGYWTASNGGTFLGYSAINSETFGATGTYTLTSESWSIT